MEKNSKILVAGHRGLVGGTIFRKLGGLGYENLIGLDRDEIDFMDASEVAKYFSQNKPDYIFLAAAKVGGIVANNTYPADFIYQNLVIQNNIIHQAYVSEVKGLLFLGSSCIYPRACAQPIREEYLLTGPLEPTNKAYALAKIAGLEMCWSYNKQYGTQYRAVMPTNLYGPGDNFHPQNSHVIPALLRKFHEAKLAGNSSVTMWGTGKPKREFLFVDDMAEACIHVMNLNQEDYESQISAASPLLNVGTGVDLTIRELGEMIAGIIGFEGEILQDIEKPDGTPQKLLDVSRMNELGWQAKTQLESGLQLTYEWFLNHQESYRT